MKRIGVDLTLNRKMLQDVIHPKALSPVGSPKLADGILADDQTLVLIIASFDYGFADSGTTSRRAAIHGRPSRIGGA